MNSLTRPAWVSIQDAADFYQVSSKTIRRWIAAGDLAAKRVGPRLLRVEMSTLANLGRSVGGRA